MPQVLDFDFYTKKPVTVKAAKLTDVTWQKISELPNHVAYVSKSQICTSQEKGVKFFLIDTLEGLMRGEIGDMLIVGVKGEVYACKPDIFKQTYDKANESEIK